MIDFTPEDLISYLYGETDSLLTAQIVKALEENWALREKLSVIKASTKRLETAAPMSPSPSTMDSIMAYARKKTKITHWMDR